MPLNDATADALVEVFLASLGLTAEQAAVARPNWQKFARALYAALKTDATVVGTATGVVAGPATAPVTGTLL